MTRPKKLVAKYMRDFPESFQQATGLPLDQQVMVAEYDFKSLDDKTAKIALYHPHVSSTRAMEMLLDKVTYLETTTRTKPTKGAQSTTRQERRAQEMLPMSPEEQAVFQNTPIGPAEVSVVKHDVGHECTAVSCSRICQQRDESSSVAVPQDGCKAKVHASQQPAEQRVQTSFTSDENGRRCAKLFPLKLIYSLQHNHAEPVERAKKPRLSATQTAGTVAALTLLPAAELSVGKLTKLVNQSFHSGQRLDDVWLSYDATATKKSETRAVEVKQVRRLVDRLPNIERSTVDPKSNLQEDVNSELRRISGNRVAATGDEQRALKFEFVSAGESDTVLVIVPDIGQRASEHLDTGPTVLHVDGTHSMVHASNVIVTTICTRICGVAVPLAFCVSRSTTTEVLIAAMRRVKQFIPATSVLHDRKARLTFMTDDSSAEEAALQSTFPWADSVLCVFHVFKSIRKMFQQHVGELAKRTSATDVLLTVDGRRQYADAKWPRAVLHKIAKFAVELRQPENAATILQSFVDENASQLAQYINSTFTKRVDNGELASRTPPTMTAPDRARKSTVSALGGTDDDREEMNEFENRCSPSAKSLMSLVYEVVNAPTKAEYRTRLTELKLESVVMGMGQFVFGYLLGAGGYLSPQRLPQVACYLTNSKLRGDHTNNTMEQLHRVMADVCLQDRTRAAGLVELMEILVERLGKLVMENLAKTSGGHADSAALQAARSKTTKYMELASAIGAEITGKSMSADMKQVVSVTVSTTNKHGGGLAAQVNVAQRRCNCHMFARRWRCVHIVVAEIGCDMLRDPRRATTLSDDSKAMLRYIGIGTPLQNLSVRSAPSEEVPELAPPASPLSPVDAGGVVDERNASTSLASVAVEYTAENLDAIAATFRANLELARSSSSGVAALKALDCALRRTAPHDAGTARANVEAMARALNANARGARKKRKQGAAGGVFKTARAKKGHK